ncbi:hypothetical protein PoB_005960200 [Plakobranchus ocellatus]|uniref:Uncharacterized protein n=1 Tax=Plakobranchus ocellatus TaxID=259542 RepID=A0AAV4CMR3_9GAST|nr:hypothetical protein PoB_005960200 [Plakobranchus ocellatus]
MYYFLCRYVNPPSGQFFVVCPILLKLLSRDGLRFRSFTSRSSQDFRHPTDESCCGRSQLLFTTGRSMYILGGLAIKRATDVHLIGEGSLGETRSKTDF